VRKFLLAALLGLAAPALWALEGGSFLNIGLGARCVALGGACAASVDDASALSWNPAGLAGLEKKELTASHAELPESVRHDFFGYAQPTTRGTFAAGFTYLSQGKLEGRDGLGRPTAGFSASDAVVAAGFGRKTESADLGASAKYIRSHIAEAEAQTLAVDLGARRELGQAGPGTLTAALAARNLGAGLKYADRRDDLPLRLDLGCAYRLPGGHVLALDWLNGPYGSGNDVAAGAEFKATQNLALRAGYTTAGAIGSGSGFETLRGLSFGLGLSSGAILFDYAVTTQGELGRAHRFTAAVRF